MVNCANLTSKWVGDTPKNIEAVFSDAKAVDAVLVFDEAEGLFGKRLSGESDADKEYINMTGILLHEIEQFPGIVILITNLLANFDSAFQRRLTYQLEFKIPTAELRERLWRSIIPPECPKADDVDFPKLAQQYEMAGRQGEGKGVSLLFCHDMIFVCTGTLDGAWNLITDVYY